MHTREGKRRDKGTLGKRGAEPPFEKEGGKPGREKRKGAGSEAKRKEFRARARGKRLRESVVWGDTGKKAMHSGGLFAIKTLPSPSHIEKKKGGGR